MKMTGQKILSYPINTVFVLKKGIDVSESIHIKKGAWMKLIAKSNPETGCSIIEIDGHELDACLDDDDSVEVEQILIW